jgi:hypothetical protein
MLQSPSSLVICAPAVLSQMAPILAQPDEESQQAVFQRFWSLKEVRVPAKLHADYLHTSD